MVLNESSGPQQDFSVALPDYFDWQRDNTVFEHLACTHKESRNLSGIPGREPERISCASITRNFFNVIGLPAEIGRTFSEDEDKVGAPPVVVIGDRLWQRAFNRDPAVIGRSINLHDQNFTIIGVMPPAMTSPQDSDAWISLMRRSNNPAWMDRSHHPMMFVWGKLKPGMTVDQARTEMKTIAGRLEKAYPDTNGKIYAVVTPLLENQSRTAVRCGRIGLTHRLREPREFVCCARRRAGERVCHSRSGRRHSRADYSQASARKFPDCDPWRSARIFHRCLVARRVDRVGT
jgi:hypothetical protein